MSTITRGFTKEQLIEKLQHRIAVAAKYPDLEEAQLDAAIFKIALASLEAEAVGEVVLGEYDDCGCHPDARVACIAADGQADWENFKDGTRLYTAPPVPVSVPDDVTAEDCPAFIKYDLTEVDEAWARGFNACRAAMLQGAEPVTTAYKLPFEQWLSQQTGTIDVECGCVMTEVFFHWLRVAYEAGNSPVIPYGWVACNERMPGIGTEIFYFCQDDGLRDCGIVSSSNFSGRGDAQLYVHAEGYDLRFGVDITHWMPLPAAPTQEDL